MTTETKKLAVTEGNVAFDKDGKKCIAGDDIALTAEQARVLKEKKIVE